MEQKKYIQSVDRALSILSYIADRGSVRLNEISEHVGLKTSTTFGLLQTLEHNGYISRKQQGMAYCLGFNSLRLGLSFNNYSGVKGTIHKLLVEIVEEIDETTYFEIKIGDRYYYYDVVLSTQPLKVVPDEHRFIDLPDNSAVTKIYRTYETGVRYATDLEEVEEGLNCFAVPFKWGNMIIGCVALTGPSYRFTKEKMEQTYAIYCNVMKRLNLEKHL